MKLRSRTPASSSSKGKAKIEYSESSDEDDSELESSDSDCNDSSDEGDGLLNVSADQSRKKSLDTASETSDTSSLDTASETSDTSSLDTASETSDTDDDDERFLNVSRRKRRNSCKNGEGSSRNVQARQEGNTVRGMNVDIEPEVFGDPLGFDSNVVIENHNRRRNKKGKKKKGNKPVLGWEALEVETEKWIAENLQMDMDLMNQNEMATEVVEPSDDLILPLLRYQKEWLAWALKQEESATRGGILADEMGMGKTLQAIALVLLKRSITSGLCGPSASTSSSKGLPAIKGTLVICPVVAAMQWLSEIEKFTSKGSTKVLIYHGANRVKNHYQFAEYDFVITTYSIVEAEYRKYIMPPKVKCSYCRKLFHRHKLNFHLKYMCGPGAVRTAKQAKQQRKEPKPKNMSEVSKGKKKAGRGKGKKHDSGGKETEDDHLMKDSAEVEGVSYEGKSILHCVMWERIILDEAHYIKDRRNNTTRAVFNLQSSYKWALTGTPLQNRVGELYSLVRFLQIAPYSYYFCKDCDCHTLDYSSLQCPHCPHKSVRHFCWWNRNIATPIQDFGNNGRGREAMLLLKHKILKSIVLRRTKKGREADLALPPRIITLRRDSLDVVEQDYYTALYSESVAQFDTYIDAGTVMNNYAHIFDLLTRLRQAVDHPYLVEYSLTTMERRGKTVESKVETCGLCNEPEEDIVVTACGHAFCKSCLIDFGASMGQNSCPSCSKPLTVDFTATKNGKGQTANSTIKGFRASSILNRIKLQDFQTSTKIDALREEIRFMVERDGSAKGIVFSQYTSFLDLIHYTLQKSGVNCVQLDGSMSMGARDAAIKKFSEDPDCKIFLMSLKAGGVALNLTAASHVFLMDPWWNPAVEKQAQDRIHRIGQYKPIRIVRFIIENTIEERILKLQRKKEQLFEGTVGGSSEALSKLTEDDLKFLFQ